MVDCSYGSAECTGQFEHVLGVLPKTPWQQTHNNNVGGWVLFVDVLQVLDYSASKSDIMRVSKFVSKCASMTLSKMCR